MTERRDRDEPAATAALRLLGKWTRLSQGHISLDMTCGCAPGMPSVSVMEFEEMIVDYVANRHRACIDAIVPLKDLMAQSDQPGVLVRLLTLLARQPFEEGVAHALLADLQNSIDSFDALHGGV